MKKQTVETRTEAQPAMEVYDSAWRFLGHVADRGTKVSREVARQQYGPVAVHVLPAIIEVSR